MTMIANPPSIPFALPDKFHTGNEGMTLRDYFAAAALQGMLAESDQYKFDNLAKAAYKAADAMLEERVNA
jgi:hypothetical protein